MFLHNKPNATQCSLLSPVAFILSAPFKFQFPHRAAFSEMITFSSPLSCPLSHQRCAKLVVSQNAVYAWALHCSPPHTAGLCLPQALSPCRSLSYHHSVPRVLESLATSQPARLGERHDFRETLPNHLPYALALMSPFVLWLYADFFTAPLEDNSAHFLCFLT